MVGIYSGETLRFIALLALSQCSMEKCYNIVFSATEIINTLWAGTVIKPVPSLGIRLLLGKGSFTGWYYFIYN